MPSANDPAPGVSGAFATMPLPRLLYELLRRAFSGLLEIVPDRPDAAIGKASKIRVAFVEGLPVDADLEIAEDALARVLLEQGWISHDDFNKSLEEIAKRPTNKLSEVWALQAQVLQEQGAVTPERLLKGRRLQLRRKLNRLFSIKDAVYHLRQGEQAEGLSQDPERQIDPLPVIYHGVCNAFDEERLNRELAALGDEPLRPSKGFAVRAGRFALGEGERKLADDLAKSRGQSLSGIVARSDLGPLETRMLVYALWITGALTTGGEEPAKEAAPRTDKPQRSAPPAAPPAGALDDLLAQYVSGGGDQASPGTSAGPGANSARGDGPAATVSRAAPRSPRAQEPEVGPLEPVEIALPATASASDEILLPAVTPPAAPSEAFAPPPASSSAEPELPPAAPAGLEELQRLKPGATGSQPQVSAITRGQPITAKEPSVGRLRSNITSIIRSIDKIATAEYEAVYDQEKGRRTKRPTGTVIRAAGATSSTGEPVVRARSLSSISHGAVEEAGPEPARAPGADQQAAPAPSPPAQPQSPLQLGITHFENKNYVTAHKYFAEAAKAQPHDGRPLAWLAWTRVTAPGTDPDQDPARNKKLLLRAIQLSPQQAEAHYFLGELYVFLGDDGRAVTCLTRALELQPDYGDARRKLEALRRKHGQPGGTGERQSIYGQARKPKQPSGLIDRLLKK